MFLDTKPPADANAFFSRMHSLRLKVVKFVRLNLNCWVQKLSLQIWPDRSVLVYLTPERLWLIEMSRGPSSYNFSKLTLETWHRGLLYREFYFFGQKKFSWPNFQKLARERNFDLHLNKAIITHLSLSNKNKVREIWFFPGTNYLVGLIFISR